MKTLPTSGGTRRMAALDGYRGIFVTLVLLYHFGVTALVGGWVGINHFFVFSGYLISRLLISERALTGTIDVVAFYRRRAERIVPAMLVLVTAVLVHTWATGDSAQKHLFGGDSLATLAFVQNWRLIARGDAYFDQVGNPSPLRHGWTLGVEEQFYLLCPLLILLIWRVGRTRVTRVALATGLALVSTLWTAVLARQPGVDFARLYYGTDTRAQALLVGVAFGFLLGRGERGRPARPLPLRVAQAMGAIGLLVSLSAFVLVEPTSSWLFRSGGMLLSAVGAAFMGFTAVDRRPMLLNRIVGVAPLALLGQMTYGLYLYHWPVRLWLGPHLSGMPLTLSVLVQLVVTIAVAFASFTLVEVPILTRGWRAALPRARRPGLWPAAAAVVLALFAGMLWRTPVAVEDLDVPPLVAGQAAYVPGGDQVRVALLGDSVAASLIGGWRGDRYPDLALTSMAQIGCDLLPQPMLAAAGEIMNDPACAAWRAGWSDQMRTNRIQVLIVQSGTHFVVDHVIDGAPAAAGSAALEGAVVAELDRIRAVAVGAGTQQVQVMTMPCRRIDPNKLDPRFRQFAEPGSDDAKVAWVNGVLARWAASHRDVVVLDLWKQLCSNGFQPTLHGVPLFHDTVHFSPPAAAMIWTWLAPASREAWRQRS